MRRTLATFTVLGLAFIPTAALVGAVKARHDPNPYELRATCSPRYIARAPVDGLRMPERGACGTVLGAK